MLIEWTGKPAVDVLSNILDALKEEEVWLDEAPDLQSIGIGGSTEECETKRDVVKDLLGEARKRQKKCDKMQRNIEELFENSTRRMKTELLSTVINPTKKIFNEIKNRFQFYIIGCRNADLALHGRIKGEEFIRKVQSTLNLMREQREYFQNTSLEFNRMTANVILRDQRLFGTLEATTNSLYQEASNRLIIQFNRFTKKRLSPGAINENLLKMNNVIESAGSRLKMEFERLEEVVRERAERIIQSHIDVGTLHLDSQIPPALISLASCSSHDFNWELNISSQIAREIDWINTNKDRMCLPNFSSFVDDCSCDPNGEIKLEEMNKKFQGEYSSEIEKKLPLMKILCSAIEKIRQDDNISESLLETIKSFSDQFEIFWTTFEKRKEELLELEKTTKAVSFVIESRKLLDNYDEVITKLTTGLESNEESSAMRFHHRHGQLLTDTKLTMELFQIKASKAEVDMTGTEKFAVYKNLVNKTELTEHEQQIEKIVLECNVRKAHGTFVEELRNSFPGIHCIDANRRNDALRQILSILRSKADRVLELSSNVSSKRRLPRRNVLGGGSSTGINPSLREKRVRQD
ncbi:unnamed protein product [Caenorhabditis brenneri]